MKISELTMDKLSDDDIYNLIMTDIKDFSAEILPENEKPDWIVVLGAAPMSLSYRMRQLGKLLRSGEYNNAYVVITGGPGFRRLFTPDQNKRFTSNEAYSEYIHKLKMAELRQKVNLLKLENKGTFHLKDKEKISDKEKSRRFRKIKGYLVMTEAELGKTMLEHDLQRKVMLEDESTNTLENVLFTKDIIDNIELLLFNYGLDKEQNDNIMLVTSPFHCRRAALTFQKRFPNKKIIACPAVAELYGRGLPLKKEKLMKDKTFMKQIRGECERLILYSNKGDIADVEISSLVGEDKARKIESKFRDFADDGDIDFHG